jgi:hypothetical protein
MMYWNWMRYGLLLSVVRLNAGCGLRYVVELDRLSLMSSVIVAKKVVERFGRTFLKVINKLTATVIFGMPTKKYFLKKLIVASVKTLDKPIMSNDGITRFANGCLVIRVKRCLFQSPMSIILGSLIFLYENTICLYHFDFYHYQYFLSEIY